MAAKHSTLTADELRAALDYDPEAGVLTWRHRDDRNRTWNTRYAGREAGHVVQTTPSLRYRQINFDGAFYRAHRIAWLYMTGEWPPEGFDVDHVDGDGLNNRWTNLRIATRAQNAANSRLSRGNTTGFKGVSFHRRRGAYIASIGVRGKQVHLGYFPTAEEAHGAYREASETMHGEFRRGST